MGKRELVLIALFVVAGAVVYQFTAPPPPPGSDLSVGGIFQRMRRGVQGPTASGNGQFTQTVPIAPGVQKLRLNLPRPCDLTITGSDRDDLTIDMQVSARGYDPAETKAAAAAAKVTVDPSGDDTLAIASAWNDRREGQKPFVTQVTLTLAIPRRLQVVLVPHIGLLTVKDVASLEATMSRGETHVTGIAGDVRLTHVGGTLEVAGGGLLKLSARNSRGDVSGFAGPVSIDANGSRLKLADIGGTLEIESRNTDVAISKIDRLTAPVRIDMTGGELNVEGLRTEARIDGRNTDVDVRLAAPAPVTIYNLGAIVVTAPPGGYTLDAVATDGRITSDDGAITATQGDGADARASVKVRGGGPVLTLRATRGRIEVRGAGK
jgi:hypothetical protein